MFDYQPGRSGTFPRKFLKGYTGYIHTDAYKGYEKVTGLTRCFCWTHLRRYFVDALAKDVANPQETIPAQAIRYINRLFELEVLSSETRKEQRLIQESPVLEAFWSWAEKVSVGMLPKSKLGEAFTYAFNQKSGLMNYLLDGNCSISNNLAENRVPKEPEASAGIYTLIETAKANGLNPRKYIQYILGDIPGSAFMQYPEYLEDYLPWDPII